MSKIIFITGGARSGKSRFAEELAQKTSDQVVYLATAQALDDEMKTRIQNHKARRPVQWITVEEPIELSKAIAGQNGKTRVILADCLTLWISNLLHANVEFEKANEMLSQVFQSVRTRNQTLILVSNEVGMGLVSEHPLGRTFTDLSGRVNQFVSREADEVYFMVSGIPLRIKP